MNFTTEEIAIITKVLIRQLMQDEGAIAELQKKLSEVSAKLSGENKSAAAPGVMETDES